MWLTSTAKLMSLLACLVGPVDSDHEFAVADSHCEFVDENPEAPRHRWSTDLGEGGSRRIKPAGTFGWST